MVSRRNLNSEIRNRYSKITEMFHIYSWEVRHIPYYFQMLCHVLWELCMDSRMITEADIGKALDILISRESSTYIAMWEELTIKQKNLMVALAKEECPIIYDLFFKKRSK